MSYYSFVVKEILLLIIAIAMLTLVGNGQNNYQKWVCNILMSVLLVVFLVWTMDTVSWLLVESMQSIRVVQSSMPSQWDLDLPLPKMIM